MPFILMLVLISSAFFIAQNIDHQCEGDSCPVCTEIASCHSNIQNFGCTGAESTCSTALVIGFIAYIICAVFSVSNNTTLISLKVELLD